MSSGERKSFEMGMNLDCSNVERKIVQSRIFENVFYLTYACLFARQLLAAAARTRLNMIRNSRIQPDMNINIPILVYPGSRFHSVTPLNICSTKIGSDKCAKIGCT